MYDGCREEDFGVFVGGAVMLCACLSRGCVSSLWVCLMLSARFGILGNNRLPFYFQAMVGVLIHEHGCLRTRRQWVWHSPTVHGQARLFVGCEESLPVLPSSVSHIIVCILV